MWRQRYLSLSNVFLAGYSLLLCAAVWLALATMHVESIDAPFWDAWLYTNPPKVLADLFRLHNSHPLATGKLLFAVDYYLFSGRGNFLRAVLVLELASSVAAIILLARLAEITDRIALVAIGCTAVVLLFSPFAFENLTWGFQVAWVAGIAGPVVSVAALAIFAEKKTPGWLALSYAALVAGMFGLASALLAPFILSFMAYWLRLNWRVAAGFLFAAVIAWSLYIGNGDGAAHPTAALHMPGAVVLYVVRYLGGLPGSAANYFSYYRLNAPDALSAATYSGLILIVANSVLAWWHFRHAGRERGVVGLLAISAICLMTAGLTALGRISAPEMALSSRYTMTGSLYTAVTIAMAFSFFSRRSDRRPIFLLSSLVVVILALVLVAAVPVIRNLGERDREETAGLTALVAGVDDTRAIERLAFRPPDAIAESARLKREGKFHFANFWARRVGSRFETTSSTLCPGTIEAGEKIGTDGIRVNGTVARRLIGGAREIVLVDASGLIVGYGRVPARPSDLYWWLMWPDLASPWQGHLKAVSFTGITAYAGDQKGWTCRIGQGAGRQGGE